MDSRTSDGKRLNKNGKFYAGEETGMKCNECGQLEATIDLIEQGKIQASFCSMECVVVFCTAVVQRRIGLGLGASYTQNRPSEVSKDDGNS